MAPPLWGGWGTSVVRNRTRIAHRGCRSGQSFASAKVALQGISPDGHLDPQPPRLLQAQRGEDRLAVGRSKLVLGCPLHPEVSQATNTHDLLNPLQEGAGEAVGG